MSRFVYRLDVVVTWEGSDVGFLRLSFSIFSYVIAIFCCFFLIFGSFVPS